MLRKNLRLEYLKPKSLEENMGISLKKWNLQIEIKF